MGEMVWPSCTTPGAPSLMLAGSACLVAIGDEVVVSTIVTPGLGKGVGEDAAFEVLAKGLADVGLGGAMVALPVELACAGKFMPSLEVLGYGLVEEGVATDGAGPCVVAIHS